MKTQLLLTILLLLSGCGDLEHLTQSQSQTQQAPSVTPLSEPSTAVTEQPVAENPGEFTGKVIKVVDGDTIDVLTDDMETIRIRFSGVDTPERGQPFGNNATRMVKELVAGEIVRIVSQGDDRYDRTVGDIYYDGTLINLALVEAGLAWHYVKYAPNRTDLAKAEQNARARNIGLWAGSHKPIAPWDWRKLSKEERDEFR
jgi:micrococcal nuclease